VPSILTQITLDLMAEYELSSPTGHDDIAPID